MPYTVPSLDESLSRLLAVFKALFPTANVGARTSYHWRRLKVIAMAMTDLHYHIDRGFDDVMPDRATMTALDRWASIVGTSRKVATPARKANALRVTGVVASAFTLGDQLTHPETGLVYQLNETGVIPAAGYIDVDVVGVSTGSATRLVAGEVLEFSAPPAGIETQASLQLDLDEDGYDAEQDGELRVRVLDRLANPSQGGSQNDYVQWALEIAGISAAFCYPNRAGIGSIDIAALHTGSGSARQQTPTERDDLKIYIQTKAPAYIAGVGGALRVLETTLATQAVEISIAPNGDPAFEFDWVDSVALVVAGWTALTRQLQFTTARPATMKVGDRLTLKGVASAQTGEQYIIESLVSTDTVALKVAPTVAPAATDIVYSGGPLVDVVRDAVVAHLDGQVVYAGPDGPLPAADAGSTVNLRVLAEGVGTANPAGAYGTWSGAIIRAVLAKIATAPLAVRNATVVLPASDVEGTDYTAPLDDQIGLLTWSSVLIRRSW